MINTFPPQNQNFKYLQTNRSDDLGSIWSSFNLDFQKKIGSLGLADKLVMNTDSATQTGLGLPIAFEFIQNKWYAICGTRIYTSTTDEITTAFTPSTLTYTYGGSDTTQYNIANVGGNTWRYTWNTVGTNPNITATNFPIGATVLITITDFNDANEGTFTITGSGSNYFEVTNPSGVSQANVAIGNSSGITVYGGPYGADYSTFYSDMTYFDNYLFTTTATKLRMTTTTSAVSMYDAYTLAEANSPHKLLYFKKKDRVYFIYSDRIIGSFGDTYLPIVTGAMTINLGYTIGALQTMVVANNSIWIGSLPVNSKTKGVISQWDGESNQVTNEYVLESGGVLAMCTVSDMPYAIDTEGRILKYTGYSFEEIARFPFDRTLLLNATAVGQKWVHHNGMIGTKNNTILIAVNNLNEDANSTINESLPSGVWELDLNNYSLTHKYAPTLKAMGSATVTDYGQNRVTNAGALKLNYRESDSTAGRSTLLAGFTVYTNASDTKSAIFIDSPDNPATDYEGQKRGYFVTTWFESPQITSNWTRLWATFKKMLNATDKMIFKYRLDDDEPVEATITWVTQTTFTTTTDVSAYEGFEAEIIQGTGSGACCDITDISEAGGTYTVTIRDAVPITATTAKARFQKWIYLGEIASQTLAYGSLPIIANDVRIQIKGILEWTGDNEFTKMAIVSKDDININP